MKDEKEYDANEAYLDALRDWIKPILVDFNKYIEDAALDEFEQSEDWMIDENVKHFLEGYKLE